ncbi:MAG: signal peptidase II [Patescibacteria group bacterium]|jgi:lipoprotein signal peptidase
MTRAHFFTGAGSVVALALVDAFTKWWAIGHAIPASSSAIPSLFAFALHKNPGIAFDIPVPFFIILPLTLTIIVLFGYYFGRPALVDHRFEEALACFMVCIGALGNFLDRAVNGFTTDYLILLHTSAINLSDLLILFGMGLFLWYHKGNPQIEKT